MSNKNKHLLVCGAEPSSDRIASMTLSALSNAGANLQSFGVGGEASQASGMEVLEPLTGLAAMGWIPATRRAWALQRAFRVLVRECRRRRPGQALLIGFTSFNQALGRELRSMGIRVLWCVAPQVWAWRPSRLDTLRHSVDRLAVLFPFEEPLWRRHGYDVHYVGHPAVELTTYADSTSFPPRLAVMMGSRVGAGWINTRTGRRMSSYRRRCLRGGGDDAWQQYNRRGFRISWRIGGMGRRCSWRRIPWRFAFRGPPVWRRRYRGPCP